MWTAVAPSATAVTTWRSTLVRTSPTANTPGGWFRGFVRYYIAALVQLQLAFHQLRGRLSAHADEDGVTGHQGFYPGVDVLEPDSGELISVEQLQDGAVPAKLDVSRLYQRLMVDLGGPQVSRR